ncbi:quinone oxidoreductase family protein [Saccharothrix sp. Mg75]|uniref:quinone oxidoreductase family protein n=1 Tax=Saccharothrix sp. Mg75 TaxID=3445357 RepID=UPI003EF081E5
MARAVGVTERGGPEVLAVVDREVREPGEGEVRIAVRAAAVNPTDIGVRERGVDDVPPPWVPGMDAAGTVEAVGPGVRRLRVGDEVMAAVTPRRPEGGAQAELLVVPEASAVPVPDGASAAEASTLPMNGLTARLGLELLGLPPGGALAVTGGAGLLASYVVPLAKRAGLVVVADAKPEDRELVLGFGADHVVPRGDGFADAVRERFPAGVDGVYDTALLHERVFGAVRDGGGVVVVRGWRPASTERGITVHRVVVGEALERTDWLEELRELASAGVLRLRVAGEYPPERAAEAHRVMDAGGLRGRVVIRF